MTTRAGWKVTKIYHHYTFKEDTFKKKFVVMNQNARKTAKTKVEKDFYKLLNNSNFGYDCRNNFENCTLNLLYDDLDEISDIKKFTKILQNQCYQELFTKELLSQQIEGDFNEKIERLNLDDPYYFALYEDLIDKKNEELEAAYTYFSKKRKRKCYYGTPNTIENKIKNCGDIRKTKIVIEFNELESSSVKTIAVKSQTNVKCSSRFMSGKPLMFAKLSLKSFVYSLVELLHFPEENPPVASIYGKYKIKEIQCYQILTDTDSTSIQFFIVSDPSSMYPECDVRDILFEIFSKSKISKRFDKSNEFWRQFNVFSPEEQKVLGLYEVENIDDPCYVTLAVNPKEYFEYFKSESCNIKHKGIKKVAVGMEYENYPERIKPLKNFNTFKNPKADSKDVVRISVKKGQTLTHKIKKNKFLQLNNKRFYFPNAAVSVPFGHFSLNQINQYKKEKDGKLKNTFGLREKNF